SQLMSGETLFDKLWESHLVDAQSDGNSLLYIDRHYVIEVTSAQAYEGIRLEGRRVRRPDSIIATPDHNIPTRHWDRGVTDPVAKLQLETLEANVGSFGALH